MHSFTTYLAEETSEEKLSHLEHAEDHVINAGDAGFQHAIATLSGTHDALSGKKSDVSLSTKYDGSPSVVFGTNPENGRFFVASKSIFNKEPKINYTPEDIDRNHGHAQGLVKKMKEALEHLKKIAPVKGVFQGDFMYSADDVKKDGRALKFTPNTITYGADKDSEEGKKIATSKMGFVVHTAYKGTSLENMKATFNPPLSGFKNSQDVHVIKPTIDIDRADHNQGSQKEFSDHRDRAVAEYHSVGKKSFAALNNSRENLKMFINSNVKKGTTPSAEGFLEYLRGSQQKDINSVKTEKAKVEKKKKWDAIIKSSEQNKVGLRSIFNMHGHLQSAKDVLVKSLANASPFKHEIDGKPTEPEGFVASLNNRPTKLVNRAEFAKANMNKYRGPALPQADPQASITLVDPKVSSTKKGAVGSRDISKDKQPPSPQQKAAYNISTARSQALGRIAKNVGSSLSKQAKAELDKRHRSK